jgi:thiopeptide-type bacteriocin biosynthesis protein
MAEANRKKGIRSPTTAYRSLDWVMVRAPLLPIESYFALGDAGAKADVDQSTLAPVDPQVRHALAIGSPSLLEALERTAPDDEKAARLTAKLRRFLVRMSTRPTPYGTFAGVALARWGGHTDLSLDGVFRTRTRVDMDWLVQYVLGLEAQPAIRNQFRWVANSATWIRHGRALLSQRMPPLAGGPSGSVSIAATPVVRQVLELARAPIPYSTLVKQLIDSTPSATAEKVERVLQQMWELGFLRTELMPPVTVEDPIKWVRDRLAPIMGGKPLCLQLDALLRAISACDTVGVEQASGAVHRAAAHAAAIGRTQTEMPLQVDMALGIRGEHLSSAIAEEAARTAELLLRLTPAPSGPPNIAGYRQAFVGRYGLEREVPLLELLHQDWGLGPVGQRAWSGGGIEPARAARRAETLQNLALGAIRDARLAVDLDEDLLGRIETHAPTAGHIPLSIDLNLFVLASSPSAIDAGEFQLMVGPNLGAPVAGRNLGRFAYLLGPQARDALNRAARRDEEYHPKHITAEVAYLPHNFRTANVALRPAVRRYEVTHGVSAGVDQDHVIPLNELVIGIRQGRFYVRWLNHEVEVLFASGHMLNPNQALPECQLLSEISRDGIAQLSSFDWGPANGYMFLPRVQSGRSILQCAQWRLESTAQGGEAPVEKAELFADWLARWRERWRVPRRVYLSWADNRLLYDLDDRAQVDDLRGELGRAGGQGQCQLQEALPGAEHAWLPSADGGHRIVELVVSLGLSGAPPKPSSATSDDVRRPSSIITPDARLRPPGSDWLYLKLYGPRSGEDELLAGSLRSLCLEVDEMKIADDWFFVRYADPDPHLRLRFRAAPERLTGVLFPMLCAWASRLVAEGKCQKFAFDTYEREVERYGGPEATVAAEALFTADSRAVVDLLACAPRVDRMLLIVVTIDDLLASLGLDAAARLVWLKRSVTSRKETSDEYRARRDHLITTLGDPLQLNASIGSVLASRRSALRQIVADLGKLEADRAVTQPLSKLYESYVHMHCNRLWADQSAERRALGLLLRARDAIAHRPEISSEPPDASVASKKVDSPPFRAEETVVDNFPPREIPDPIGGQ